MPGRARCYRNLSTAPYIARLRPPRRYFELGNLQNKQVYGPLLDRWPDPEDITENFDDLRGPFASWSPPTEEQVPSLNGEA
ncbi:hypothetical protein GGR56DRAFT_633519 [Xylariaceae sp. FL0804]|nr:hypothetical protein GGR56DRAFT_633519 [Xylariaceae sp. FL0804]